MWVVGQMFVRVVSDDVTQTTYQNKSIGSFSETVPGGQANSCLERFSFPGADVHTISHLSAQNDLSVGETVVKN